MVIMINPVVVSLDDSLIIASAPAKVAIPMIIKTIERRLLIP